jgi:hypothetical protein
MKSDKVVITNSSLTQVTGKLGPPQDLKPIKVLEAFARDELDDDQLISTLILCGQTDPNKVPETLSLLDLYHRRGLLETSVFLAAKTEVSMLAVFSPPTDSADTADRPAMTALDQFSSGMFDASQR